MRAEVAVATVNGKAYFQIVNALKQREIPFLSLNPGDSIPLEVKVVITTPEEKHLTHHDKIVVYDFKTEPSVAESQVIRILHGNQDYESVVIGVDPGEMFGLAVVADGGLIDTENCLSTEETLKKVKSILRTINISNSTVTVKIGSGVPIYKELLVALDEALPPKITLEIVSEAGTNGYARGVKNRRGFRHVISAARIAARSGYVYPRRKQNE